MIVPLPERLQYHLLGPSQFPRRLHCQPVHPLPPPRVVPDRLHRGQSPIGPQSRSGLIPHPRAHQHHPAQRAKVPRLDGQYQLTQRPRFVESAPPVQQRGETIERFRPVYPVLIDHISQSTLGLVVTAVLLLLLLLFVIVVAVVYALLPQSFPPLSSSSSRQLLRGQQFRRRLGTSLRKPQRPQIRHCRVVRIEGTEEGHLGEATFSTDGRQRRRCGIELILPRFGDEGSAGGGR
mmetsp:Transcript_5982/g.17302  ORF Transcript_5982/g.17302 Transcript_5982/m.17302 type:complete len:235 (+) Transcript_5982:241-945(+)